MTRVCKTKQEITCAAAPLQSEHFLHTYDDLHGHVAAAVVRLVFIPSLPFRAPFSLLQHYWVEVAPLLHQLPCGRVTHLVGLTREGAAQTVRTQDNCGQSKINSFIGICTAKSHSCCSWRLVSVYGSQCTPKTGPRNPLQHCLVQSSCLSVLPCTGVMEVCARRMWFPVMWYAG